MGGPPGGKGGKLPPPPPAKGGKASATMPAEGGSAGSGAAPVAAKTWKAVKPVKLADNNKETLACFREALCYSSEEVLQTPIDWANMQDLAVIKGSLEIDEALTGIVVTLISGRLLALRNICVGRQPAPVHEYFAVVLNRLLGMVPLAEWRVLHRQSPGDEYAAARAGLRACLQHKTGLQGLTDEVNAETEDNPYFWLAANPNFTDFHHDLVRVLRAFFVAPKTQPSFIAVLQVAAGLRTLVDGMTLRQEISINTALNLSPADEGYVCRSHSNPLHDCRDNPETCGNVLQALGRLTAFDAIVNNWDRVGWKMIWDNKGNLTNVCVERCSDSNDDDALRLVGVDQAVHPIDGGIGLQKYRQRLQTLVQQVLELEGTDFISVDLQRLDSTRRREEIFAGYIREESAREQREQAAILGRRVQENQHDGLADRGDEAQTHSEFSLLTEALCDLAKEIYCSTGVLFELAALARHFVGGLAAGFRDIAGWARGPPVEARTEKLEAQGVELEALLRRVADEVRAGFGETEDRTIDLENAVAKCVDFVQGNMEVVGNCF